MTLRDYKKQIHDDQVDTLALLSALHATAQAVAPPGPALEAAGVEARLRAALQAALRVIPAAGAAVLAGGADQPLSVAAVYGAAPPDGWLAHINGRNGAAAASTCSEPNWLSAPLLAGSQPLGCLAFVGAPRAGFTATHARLAELVAQPIAAALVQEHWLDAVRAQTEQMRGLSARLTDLEEHARRRLSQELHDRVGQSLTALTLNLTLAHDQVAAAGAIETANRLRRCLQLAEEMSEQVRDVMVELRPPMLDDYGLLAALRWYAGRFEQDHGLAVQVLGADLPERLPLIVETALFRITQEALTNVSKHAQARQVTITLEETPSGARLSVADDGQGFSPERPRGLGERPRWGLITMRERAETVGAAMRIQSAAGQGTRVMIEVAR